jgi:nucleotide-binding universal stress UspA family protein
MDVGLFLYLIQNKQSFKQFHITSYDTKLIFVENFKTLIMDKTFIDPNSEQGNNNQNANDPASAENQQKSNQEQRSPSDTKKNRIVLNNVTKSQKEKILAIGGSGLIGAIGGAGAFAFLSFVSDASTPVPPEPEPIEPDPIDPIEPDPVIIYTEAPFANSENDDMDFGEAFGAARAEVGPGGFFEWHGNTYNTYYKEEWESLSPDERDEFLASVDDFEVADNETEIVDNDNIGTDAIEPEPTAETTDETNETTNEAESTDDVVETGPADQNIEIKIIQGAKSRAGAIVTAAKQENCDTIVFGRKGKSNVSSFDIGRVPWKVIHGAREMTVWMVP